MNGIIIYKSSCGSTKQYADWIGQELGFQTIPIADAKNVDFGLYDIIIAGSLVIASKMVIGKWIEKRWEHLKNKEIILYSTSGAKPSEKVQEEFLKNSLPTEIAKQVSYFPMHGRRRQQDLSMIARLMMWIAVTFIAKDEQEKEDMRKDFDGVDRKYIEPLVLHVKRLIAEQ
jgi:menaquinone-dependent protoporphyrinogen IX oxidase